MCQFNLSFAGNAEGLMRRAKQAIEGAGGNFMGTADEGAFTAATPIGSIKGSYKIEGQVISLTITQKPFLLSCSRIEKELTAVMR